ncbi:MAG: acetyl-CoA carboxylase biotin carboxyl carrier protein [Planctomycetota bacterium]
MAKTPSRSSDDNSAAASDPMDVDRLERLVALMSDQGLTNLELQDGDRRISLSRGHAVAAAPVAAPVAAPAPAPAPAPAASPAPAAAPSAPASDSNLATITSPMVGTYYAAPKPGSPAFVEVGKSVSDATDVCIIEAMKVFNTIKAETSGVIDQILVKDGDAVEFGQALFKVRPA